MQRCVPTFFIAVIGIPCPVAFSEDGPSTPSKFVDRVNHLVAHLGHPQYEQREQAHRKLLELGEDVLPVLEKLDQPGDLEVRWRLRSVIKKFRRDPLVGTQWRIEATSKANVRSKTIEFLPDGKFRVVQGARSTPDDETWEPESEQGIIRFHFNNKYATYEGRRVDNRTMIGESHNIKGKTWTWRATLVGSSEE